MDNHSVHTGSRVARGILKSKSSGETWPTRVSLGTFLVLPSLTVALLCLTVGHRWSEESSYSVSVPTTRTQGVAPQPLVQTRQRSLYFAGWPLSYFGSSQPSIQLRSISWLNFSVDIIVAFLAATVATKVATFVMRKLSAKGGKRGRS